ncbi:alpha/beta fold hydrolase [Streptomyces sp. NPDC048419]|uniref:alpha/beta fold hydrolase n=1 Tax=Streptomyces sp. NPDC048419 TaxID=3365547 RepID=UPI00371002FC
MQSTTPVVLVHGFWHGSWCWSLVSEQLASRGVASVAVDLDGHGLKSRAPDPDGSGRSTPGPSPRSLRRWPGSRRPPQRRALSGRYGGSATAGRVWSWRTAWAAQPSPPTARRGVADGGRYSSPGGPR